MWKPEHRLAADRNHLRYPSDLTDAEWAIVAAMIPPGRHGGRRRSVNVREVLNGSSTCCGPAANGRRYPRICRRRARCTTISSSGTGTAPWSASITRCTWRSARRRDVKQARRWRSSTRRPRRALKKGAWARFRLRRGQEDQGSQAAHPGRHAGSPVERCRSSRRYSGPRWRLPLAAPGATTIPVHRTHFCRRRIRGTQDGDDGVAHWCLEFADRQAIVRCWI